MIKGVPEARRDMKWHARHLKRIHKRDGKPHESYMPEPQVTMPKKVIIPEEKKVEPFWKKFIPRRKKYENQKKEG